MVRPSATTSRRCRRDTIQSGRVPLLGRICAPRERSSGRDWCLIPLLEQEVCVMNQWMSGRGWPFGTSAAARRECKARPHLENLEDRMAPAAGLTSQAFVTEAYQVLLN